METYDFLLFLALLQCCRIYCRNLLLRSHQASQQTNFGLVRCQPGLRASEARLIWDVFWMYVYHRILPRLQVIEIGLRKNFDHQSGIDVEEKILFRVESHISAGEEFESKWRLFKFP